MLEGSSDRGRLADNGRAYLPMLEGSSGSGRHAEVEHGSLPRRDGRVWQQEEHQLVYLWKKATSDVVASPQVHIIVNIQGGARVEKGGRVYFEGRVSLSLSL